MHIGAPACGMNAAVRSFVRNAIYRGDMVLGIHDGMEGLMSGNIKPMGKFFLARCEIFLIYKLFIGWSDVTGWVGAGGAYIGTKRTLPGSKVDKVAAKLAEFGIQGLLIIGGFEVRVLK